VAIVSTDILFVYSGGAANSSANANLGGAISTVGATGGTLEDNVANDLFDDVSSAEQAAGDVEYRGIYVKNNHGTLTLQDARVYVTSFAELDVGIAVEAINTTMATIANESTAPTSVTFAHPSTYSAGTAINSTTGLVAGAYRGVWVRRTIGAGAASGTRNTETLAVEGATL
jgi:hypothetical protein